MMNHPVLQQLRPVARRIALRRALFRAAACIALIAVAAAGALMVAGWLGIGRTGVWVCFVLAAIVSVLACIGHGWFASTSPIDAARAVESAHPDLNGLVLTAAEQRPGPDGRFNFLQCRILDAALDHARRNKWSASWPLRRLAPSIGLNLLAIFALLFGLPLIPMPTPLARVRAGSKPSGAALPEGKPLVVTPGDTELERGSSLVVLARFNRLPKSAELVVLNPGHPERRLPLVRNLADPVFGGAVSDVTNGFSYRVESDIARSPDYKVVVFEYPELQRPVADITYPEYVGKPVKHIEDTRRITAVEGSHLDLSLQLNKPVVQAVLVSRTTNAPSIPLVVSSNQPVATLLHFPLVRSASYDLYLADGDGRSNRTRAQFTFEVPPNRPPELRLALPRGDIRPSPLEEIAFSGTVSDDFGILAFGLGIIRAGGEPELTELGRDVPAADRRSFAHELRLEDLGARPDDVYGWFLWADDIGPDGQRRRTSGDIFFGEVRSLEEIFREGESSQNSESGESQGGSQSGNPATRLAELQKQIITATWKLQNRRPAPKLRSSRFDPAIFSGAQYFAQAARPRSNSRTASKASSSGSVEDDLKTIREAASQALEQARSLIEEQQDPAKAEVARRAVAQMERSIELLDKAAKDPGVLKEAVAAQQSAYQAILQLIPRESNVSRQRNRSQSSSQSNSRNQQQVDELDLAQSEDRYETARQAQSPQDAERREQSQVLNRLQDLARRQEEMNRRLQELQTALQSANEPQKEELQRQLKRLQEEQRQNIADADELQQRMQRSENQSQYQKAQEHLEQSRQQMQQAAEATAEGKASQALAAGARAQQQLKDLREDLRKENARELDDAARDLRAQARELARNQQELQRELNAQPPAETGPRSLENKPAQTEATRRIEEKLEAQRARLTNLVDRASQLSQQAEGSEPTLSRQLYDSVREFSQAETTDLKQMREQLIREGRMSNRLYQRMQESAESGSKSLDVTRELLRQGLESPARDAEKRTARNIDRLRQGIEKAAASVAGDDTEALRTAQQQIDSAASELEREMAQAAEADADGNASSKATSASPNEKSEPSAQPGQQAQGPGPGAGEPQEPGQEPSPRSGQAQGQPRGQRPQPGQQAQGQGPGEGEPQEPGQEPSPRSGQAQGQPRGQRPQPGQQAQGQGPGAGEPQEPGQEPSPRSGQAQGQPRGQRTTASRSPSGGGAAPLTGPAFSEWSDRLREAEELIDSSSLRSQVANARDEARRVRIEYSRGREKPDWAQVKLQVVKPLLEVRDQIREELARRAADNPLVPLDRDPVPGRYSEMVRRYYEQLGRDK